ncbi:hypothetical protein [Spirochaeta lutea]|uniref:Uncharacterized protein n=1 Tax=Spirochaeta lutea TaxID=1480694 RepID=A0A098QSR6_9SPIO|nr:hypothetical protein [Spirochaeta lutea]KGE70890.1 hypothetical protein DC28_13100 [Spirochaeta lutea]
MEQNKDSLVQVRQERQETCCGGPAPQGVDACCNADAEAKASGKQGCGCGTSGTDLDKTKTCC